MSSTSQLWAIVLAGGAGKRLESISRDADGRPAPKQFCALGSNRTLLEQALDRAALLVAAERILVVVQEAHAAWWQRDLADIPARNIVVERSNRGTAIGVFHAWMRALERDRNPRFVVLPSDHGIEDERAWHETLRRAVLASTRMPEQLVLVVDRPGIHIDFGWVLPGARHDDGTRSVLAFVEKPGPAKAAELIRRGGLCSTFAFASTGATLLRLFSRLPYEGITERTYDFSRDVLECSASDVRVLPCLPCGWTDLGTPARLERWLALRGMRTESDVYEPELATV